MTTDDQIADIIRDANLGVWTVSERMLAELFAAVMVRARDEYDGEANFVIATLRAAGWRPPAARGDHEIVWYLDGDHVRGEAACHLEPGADCRVTCPKGCEEIEGFSRDDDGRPFHTVWDEAADDEIEHQMVPMTDDDCNVALWLNEEPAWISEQHASTTKRHEIGRLPIEPVWTGDHYEFKATDGGEPRA
jgi:hypothetical protein